MLRNAPPLAAWCAADPGSILLSEVVVPAQRRTAKAALHRVRDTRLSRSVIPGRAQREPGIHNHHTEYGFRARAASGNGKLPYTDRSQKFLSLLARRKAAKFAVVGIMLGCIR